MARITIIPEDGFVNVDGDPKFHPLDLSGCGIPADIHALQWYDTRGWLEFNDDGDPFTPKPPNEEINQLPTWAENCVVVWEEYVPPPDPEPPVPNKPAA